MGNEDSEQTSLKKFRFAGSTISHFFARKSLKNTLILGIVLLVYTYSKADGFVKAYPTAISRARLASTLGSNVGVEALLGVAHDISSVGGYVVWNFLCIITAAGAIWGLLFATKSFRGQEDSGCMELFLAGQTSMRKATVKILGAFGVGILLLYGLLLLCIGVIGKLPGASGFTLSASMFFALSLCSGAVMFLALGALTSQLMPTRSKAAGLAAVVFGVFYVIRLAADTSSYHWLLDLSPLGWVEKLQPMYNSDPVWLIPIGLFTLVVIILSVYLSGKRDVYSAVLADSQSSKPHKALLGSAFLSAIRINRAVIIGWLAAISVTTVLYSMLAKGAVQSLSKSSGLGKGLKRLSANHAQSILSTKSFMGIVFLIVILTAMFYIANAVGRIREDEGLGYLDNFLVRPFSRTRWLAGRLALATASIVLLGLLTAGSSWIGQASQHSGLAFSSLLAAGMNAMVPVVFVLASAVFIFGFLPRLTRSAAYIVLGWSFLITLLSSGLNINHWILDSSIFHQISLAPAVNPNWHVNLFILLISVALLVVGGLGFNNRDLAGE